MLNDVGYFEEDGFTLMEVLVSLLISCSILILSLRLLSDQWWRSKEINARQEIQYALLIAGETISKAIRSAQTVQCPAPGVLEILPWPEAGYNQADVFYIDDKDRDGITDLYCEHLNVPNPVASWITNLTCTEVEPDLWQITFQAEMNQQQAVWVSLIRRRT
ncbi:MAG: prepilin-type N-terminal cleavage/methylation domain-containing protein [Desulfitobacteriaceae bacterium]|nr:prepilin-type N-terminal cleavage/methylation domain-containing protein [Desulfitobacteriaceae bacterium]MDD4346830.1 prepilin-type N-terminal cleavage/methylation domain-containing protein [Desulfitobacteriaceae bacterium]MDD4401049.1 prepilin-type N-terminal cleavage/methylation domain-containing protein [Desulfitobacteriaceae bacterium]